MLFHVGNKYLDQQAHNTSICSCCSTPMRLNSDNTGREVLLRLSERAPTTSSAHAVKSGTFCLPPPLLPSPDKPDFAV